MGIDFRDARYRRFVTLGKRTVKDGECMVVWNRKGAARVVVGPRLERLWCSQIRFLDRFTASPEQYLCVRHKSGRVEHVRGPALLYENPVDHDDVEVCDAIVLKTEAELVVLYREVAIGVAALACVVVLTLALLGLLSYKVFCRKGGLRGRRRDLTSHASIELTPHGAIVHI